MQFASPYKKWVQFHPLYCPEAKNAKPGEWDTSHDVSVIREDGDRYWIAKFRHADDAGEYCALMNGRKKEAD